MGCTEMEIKDIFKNILKREAEKEKDVLLPALKPACSSAMNFSACVFNLFSMVFSMTLLGWLMRLIAR